MLEPVHPGTPLLSQDCSEQPALLAVAEQQDGALLVARCGGDGQHLILVRLPAALGTPPEVRSASVLVATRDAEATAMRWLPTEEPLLCVGFSHGGVSLMTADGDVRLSFLLAQRPVLRIHVGHPAPSTGQRKLLLLHDCGVVAVAELAAGSLGGALGRAAGPGSERGERPPAAERGLQFQVCELRGRAEIADVCLVNQVRQLEDIFETRSADGVVAIGIRPFLSLHSLAASGSAARSLLGSAASALSSYAKSWIPFRGGRGPAADEPLATAGATGPSRFAGMLQPWELQAPAQAAPPDELPVAAKFIDPTRSGERIVAAPRRGGASALGATCDGYGRVGLFCLETLRCLHLWKGYRDAQVAWLRRPGSEDAPGSPASDKTDEGSLALVLYAPRRGLLELWDVGSGREPRRMEAIVVDVDGRLLASQDQVYLLSVEGRVDRVRWHRAVASPKGLRPGTSDGASETGSDSFGSVLSREEQPAAEAARLWRVEEGAGSPQGVHSATSEPPASEGGSLLSAADAPRRGEEEQVDVQGVHSATSEPPASEGGSLLSAADAPRKEEEQLVDVQGVWSATSEPPASEGGSPVSPADLSREEEQDEGQGVCSATSEPPASEGGSPASRADLSAEEEQLDVQGIEA